jgi:hypothetical protein
MRTMRGLARAKAKAPSRWSDWDKPPHVNCASRARSPPSCRMDANKRRGGGRSHPCSLHGRLRLLHYRPRPRGGRGPRSPLPPRLWPARSDAQLPHLRMSGWIGACRNRTSVEGRRSHSNVASFYSPHSPSNIQQGWLTLIRESGTELQLFCATSESCGGAKESDTAICRPPWACKFLRREARPFFFANPSGAELAVNRRGADPVPRAEATRSARGLRGEPAGLPGAQVAGDSQDRSQ